MDSNQLYTSEIVKETFFTNMEQILIMWIKVWSSLNDNEKNIVKQLVDEASMTSSLYSLSDIIADNARVLKVGAYRHKGYYRMAEICEGASPAVFRRGVGTLY